MGHFAAGYESDQNTNNTTTTSNNHEGSGQQRGGEDVAREGQILNELLEISEQRESLQSMLTKDRARYRQEDRDIEAQMKANGLSV